MTDPATGQRSFLQALKVPFDLKGVGVGAMAWVTLVLVSRGIGHVAGGGAGGGASTGLTGFFDAFGSSLSASIDSEILGKKPGGTPASAQGSIWEYLALYLAVSAFFGVACCRIAAMRLARDEGTGLGDSLAYSVRNLKSTLGAILFMAASMAVFYACNALAGFLSGIPGVGPFLMIPLFPLTLISTLVLFLLVFGSLLGLPLTVASLAVERNGALDAVSRAFSYVFSRPVLFFFYMLTVGFLVWVLAVCAASMEGLATWSFTHWFPSGESYGSLRTALGRTWVAAASLRLPEYGGIGFPTWLGAGVSWVFALAFHLGLMGWIVYYGWGGATAAYFTLRRDVDGTEDEEIWVEGEGGERFGEPEKPVPATSGEAKPPEKAEEKSAEKAAGKPPAAP